MSNEKNNLTQTKNNLFQVIYEVTFVILAVIAILVAIELISNNYIIINKDLALLLDYYIQILFVTDYFIRLIISKNKILFFKKNIFDLIAIIPFNSIFKIFRLGKVFKIFKLIKILKFSRILALILRFINKIKKFFKTNGLIYLLMFTSIIILFSSITISMLEGMNFLDSLWWSFVTSTTVGYGDISPSTTSGRIVAALLMIVGIGTIGMLTGTITTYFFKESSQYSDSSEIEKIIVNSKEFTDDEKTDLINYINYVKFKRRNKK